MAKRLKVKLERKVAMHVNRVSVGNKKLVYVLLAQKPEKYLYHECSRVVYIGTTKKGIDRIAKSVAARADKVFGRGVKEFTVRILTCAPRPNVKTWEKLERALLLVFRQKYGKLPKCNTRGNNMRELDEFRCFRRDRLEKLLKTLE